MASASEPQVTTVPETGAKWSSVPGDYYRIQMQISLSPEMNQVLEGLRERYRMASTADVLNLAVGVLKYLSDAVDEGKRVGIASPDQELETEITGLGTA
jgi:hypothetical protein